MQCTECIYWDIANVNAEGFARCSNLNVSIRGSACCPGWRDEEMSDEDYDNKLERNSVEVQRMLAEAERKAKQRAAAIRKEKRVASAGSKEIKAVSHRRVKAMPTILHPDKDIKQVELLEHQVVAFNKFKGQNEMALFFEMGCGKTITSLSIMWQKFKEGIIDSLLVIATNEVHRQWYDDILFPDPKVGKVFDDTIAIQCVFGKGGQKELYDFADDKLFHIVITNVDTFSTPKKWEEIVEWALENKTAIIIDEATSIKNVASKRCQRLLYEFNHVVKRGKRITSSVKINEVRCVLTGTPVTNGPIDLWAIMEFVQPDYFHRNYYSFKNYFGMYTRLTITDGAGRPRDISVMLTEKTWKAIKECSSYGEAFVQFGCSEDTYMTIKQQDKFMGPHKHADELRALLEPVSVFAKLVDCADMPAVNYLMRYVEMSQEQQQVYDQIKKEYMTIYDNHLIAAKNKLVAMIKLQQISSGFVTAKAMNIDNDNFMFEGIDTNETTEGIDLLPNEVVWLGKSCPKLDRLMDDIAEVDKPILIITRYSAEAARIYEMCSEAGYNTGLFTGWKIIGGIQEFQDGRIDILVANIAKVARGFNLQRAHVTLFYSNTFSMELRQQSEFRTFRLGQTHPCMYIDYVCSEADEIVLNALKLKKSLLDYIRDKNIIEIM